MLHEEYIFIYVAFEYFCKLKKKKCGVDSALPNLFGSKKKVKDIVVIFFIFVEAKLVDN